MITFMGTFLIEVTSKDLKLINFGHETWKRCALYVHQLRKILDPIMTE